MPARNVRQEARRYKAWASAGRISPRKTACFFATPTHHPGRLAITNIENFASTQLMVRVSPVDNARSYEVSKRLATADWKNAGVFTKSRGVLLHKLMPGSTYDVQARAVGGTTGYSDWSDPVSHLAT